MAHILKSLMLVLKNLSKLTEVDASGEVACVSRCCCIPAQALRAQGSFVGLSPGGAALPQRDCLLQSVPDFSIQCSRIIATGPFSVQAAYFPSEAPLACTWWACGASAWPHQCFPCFGACRWLEGNFWISAHQWAAEKEEQAHGLLLEQQHLMRVNDNLWSLLAFYFFIFFYQHFEKAAVVLLSHRTLLKPSGSIHLVLASWIFHITVTFSSCSMLLNVF